MASKVANETLFRVAKTMDAVEKLVFDWDRAPERDQKCIPRSPRSLITRLIATFFRAESYGRGKRSFSTASMACAIRVTARVGIRSTYAAGHVRSPGRSDNCRPALCIRQIEVH